MPVSAKTSFLPGQADTITTLSSLGGVTVNHVSAADAGKLPAKKARLKIMMYFFIGLPSDGCLAFCFDLRNKKPCRSS
jgi:hypothetical protein